LGSNTVDLVIEPPKRWIAIDWRELWRYRDLFLMLAWRDISVRYKQTALGVIWALLQPIIQTALFTLVFNRLAKIPSDPGTPYVVFVYVGLLLWQYYSGTLTKASEAMVTNAQLIQKVYFPRLIVPAATSIVGLVDMAIGAAVLCVLMVYYGYALTTIGSFAVACVVLVALLVCTVLAATGLGLFLGALNVKFRDVRYALPFFIQMLMFVTPVMYPATMLDKFPAVKWTVIVLNPMSGVITNARAVVLGAGPADWGMIGISFTTSLALFLFGLYYFRKTERYFADIV
jgi:lipopolysaccharide transport system permease protein